MRNLAAVYRPTKLDDVVGQEDPKKVLRNHLQAKPKSGYLFVGSAGTGKTTCARIFAHELNGQSNIYEINAADNTGVEGVRKIISDARHKPIGTKYKIFILDECHMLTVQAWNALLKLVEEPPESVVLLFCTTDPRKIPNTITSRVLRLDFTRIDIDAVTGRLLWILEQENITGVQREPLRYIAQLANGGMRDAITMLDKVLGYGVDINFDVINTALGLVGFDVPMNILKALYDNNFKGLVDVLDDINRKGVDFKAWVQDFRRFVLQAVELQLGVKPEDVALPKDISSNLMLLPQDGRLFQTLCSLDDLVQLIIMEPDPYTLVKVHFLRIAGDF